MPSAMIHLLTAQAFPDGTDPMFRLGSLAPDYIVERERKDALHLRREPDRAEALERLRDRLDTGNPFEAGWLLHLLADLRWDTLVIPAYRETLPRDADWFPLYRKECHRAGYALYHSLPWSREAVSDVLRADLEHLNTALDLDLAALEAFRRMIVRKQEESPADSRSEAFPIAFLERFARETAEQGLVLLRRTGIR